MQEVVFADDGIKVVKSVQQEVVFVGSAGIQGRPGVSAEDLALVAQTGSYNDLIDRPVIPSQYTDSQAAAAAPVQSVAGKTGAVTVAKADVGLPNVDDTSDLAKPVSTAMQTALNGKSAVGHGHAQADIAGLTDALLGKAPLVHGHAISDTTGLQDALDAKVDVGDVAPAEWGAISGAITDQPDLVAELSARSDIDHGHTLDSLSNVNTSGKVDDNLIGWDSATGKWIPVEYPTPDMLGAATQADLTSHTANSSNPHGVTKAQVGLGNVNNTSDADKPVSTAQAAADALRVNKSGDTMTGNLEVSTSIASTSLFLNNTSAGGKRYEFYSDNSGRFGVWNKTDNIGPFRVLSDASAESLLVGNNRIIIGGQTAGVNIVRGTGFPNGVVSAPVGSIYIDTAITNGASSWIKKSGTGNTGWSVLEGDTSRRTITSMASGAPVFSGGVWIQRVGSVVTITISDFESNWTSSGWLTLLSFAALTGFKASSLGENYGVVVSDIFRRMNVSQSAGVRIWSTVTGTQRTQATISFITPDSWPTTLPGTAA